MIGRDHDFDGAPQELPPGFADFARHRTAYFDARRADSERRCAERALRDALAEIAVVPPDEDGERR